MSLRLEMLQVARLAPKLLGESADLVRDFLLKRQHEKGGFGDRAGNTDLYYSVFGLDGLIALQARPTYPLETYLRSYGDGAGLDFVHLCCLARAWAGLADLHQSAERPPAEAILRRIEAFRTKDGGYHVMTGCANGTAYGCFLALGAYQDLHALPPEPMRLVQCLKFLETNDGAWANDRGVKVGSTNATAAAVMVLRQLNLPIHAGVGEWLLARAHPEGGFLAMPAAPIPDLLSTATALHALAGLEVSLASVKEPCLDFIDTLWTNEGGFYGQWADEHVDVEYTNYGLLALGHLSLA